MTKDVEKIYSNETVERVLVNSFDKLNKENVLLNVGDSRNLNWIPDKSVDIIATDPPYGANVMYSELIDFFHVWNHMSNINDELGFVTPLSPKIDEIVVNDVQNKDFGYYEDGITSVLKECYKKLKDDGYLFFSFHDKSLECWLSILNSIYRAGFVLSKNTYLII